MLGLFAAAAAGAPTIDEATRALAEDASLVRELAQQNRLLREQNAALLAQGSQTPKQRATLGDLERATKFTKNNPYDADQYEKIEVEDPNWHAKWKMVKTNDHHVEWGEDHYAPWPGPDKAKTGRPIPQALWPEPNKRTTTDQNGYPPGELMYRTWMVLSGKIQDGRMEKDDQFYDYAGHYCPAIFAPPVFTAIGGHMCRTCLTVVNELLDYLNTEQTGHTVPEAMRTDTDQMQTAFVKLCSLVADADPAMVIDCKNIVEYWGTEIWCHIASGIYIDEGDQGQRPEDCPPNSDRPCTVTKPLGKERKAWQICQHLKMAAKYDSKETTAGKQWCKDIGTNAEKGEGMDRNWHKWSKMGQMPLCCPSMLVPPESLGPEEGPVKNHAAQRSVAEYGKHYNNADMIDLRWTWHEKDKSDREQLGLDDPLPVIPGAQEGLFNIGTEW